MATATPPTEAAGAGKGLVCAVCREIYRSPRILPCFHTFCLYCLEGLSRANGSQFFPCPTCRNPTAVPPSGTVGFQVNFYITENELEAARNGPGSTMCSEPAHQTSPLEYFCVPCDTAICLKCKLTKHERHDETLDLSVTAAKCRDQLEVSKDRLEQVVDVLTKKSAQAYENLNAAKQKGTEIKAEIQAGRDALIARVRRRCDAVLEQVERSNSSHEEQLSIDARAINQELDALLQLRQRILHGLSGSASHAEVVNAEKEMREGQGSAARLEQVVSNCSPVTSLRPGLRRDRSSCSDGDIDRCLGVPMALTLPFDAAPEVALPIYQCGQDGACRQVNSVCHVNDDKVLISFGGMLPDYADEKLMKITDEGEVDSSKISQKNCKVTYMYYSSRPDVTSYVRFGKETSYNLYAKGGVLMATSQWNDTTQTIKRVTVKSESPFRTVLNPVFDVHCGRTVGFDATQDEQLFAFVEQGESTESIVHLFHRDEQEPFTTYRPAAIPGFHPTDVCFWRENGQEEKLLVADAYNDAVHVVSVENDQCRFERYLTAGNGLLVHPTALNVDRHNRVWIGCGNGRILRCDPPKADQRMEGMAHGDAQSVVDSSEVDQLMVRNPSSPTDTMSQTSD